MNDARGEDDVAPGVAAAPPRGLLDRIGGVGAAAQASVPGLYAWSVTVLPAVFARGVSVHWTAKVLALGGLASLVVAIVTERRWGPRARYVAVWGLSLTSGFAWLIVPAATLGPTRLDYARGASGMVGWALFAFACAAPALKRDPATVGRPVDEAPLKPRARIRRGDAAYIATAVVVAAALELVGWRVAPPERALLVRLVSIAVGLALIGGATAISLARHNRSVAAPTRVRLRRAIPWLAGVLMLAIAGLVLALRA